MNNYKQIFINKIQDTPINRIGRFPNMFQIFLASVLILGQLKGVSKKTIFCNFEIMYDFVQIIEQINILKSYFDFIWGKR